MVVVAAQSTTDDDNGRHGRPGGRHLKGSCSSPSEEPTRSPFNSQSRSVQGSRSLNTSPTSDLRESKSPSVNQNLPLRPFRPPEMAETARNHPRPSNPLTSTRVRRQLGRLRMTRQRHPTERTSNRHQRSAQQHSPKVPTSLPQYNGSRYSRSDIRNTNLCRGLRG